MAQNAQQGSSNMKSLAEIKQILQKHQVKLVEDYGVTVIGVFGSYVRNEQGPESDVDILLDVPEDAGLDLFDLVRLQNELTDLLGVRADIALKRNLRKRIGERILQEVVNL